MKSFDNALQVYSLLNKSNCRECHLATCLAFAGAVYTGAKKLSDCPHISQEILAKYNDRQTTPSALEKNIILAMNELKGKISTIDLKARASQLGGTYNDGKITIQVLGKNFSVCDNGEIQTAIHVNPWITLPVYTYLLIGGSTPLSGRWVPLRELPGGKDWYRLFGQRCEQPLKKVADDYPDLFDDLIRMFNGKQVEKHYASDISLVLYPLPKLPMLICYWYPEGKMNSELNLFFDDTAEDYLDLNSINSIGSGFVTMLEKLTQYHGMVK